MVWEQDEIGANEWHAVTSYEGTAILLTVSRVYYGKLNEEAWAYAWSAGSLPIHVHGGLFETAADARAFAERVHGSEG